MVLLVSWPSVPLAPPIDCHFAAISGWEIVKPGVLVEAVFTRLVTGMSPPIPHCTVGPFLTNQVPFDGR